MSKKSNLVVVKDENKPRATSQSDGRRQRSQRSREKILKACWELMLDGDMNRVPHTAGEIGRFKSQVLMDDYQRSRNLEISGIKAILPKGSFFELFQLNSTHP